MLVDLLNENQVLISVSRPIMNKVFDSFIDKTKLMFLCDSKGYIVNMVSSPEIIQWSLDKGLVSGACLDYYSFGVNSISLAIYSSSPATIIGSEHHCIIMDNWSCTAIPLKTNGQTIGILNISTEAQDNIGELSALIEVLAELIELQLTNDGKQVLDKSGFFGKVIVGSDQDYTIKEVEILYLLYSGKSSIAILEELRISKNTMKTHLKRIYQKMNVTNMTDCLNQVNEVLNKQL